jgi:hypothetical protein
VVRAATIAIQWCGKHATATERLRFLRGPCQGVILKTIGSTRQLRVQLWCFNQRATEAEESPLPRFITMKLLVKTLQRNSHSGQRLPNKD